MGAMVTVIVPVYNVGEYLEETIQSVRTQTYRDLEILLIDNGSVDDSAEIAKRAAGEDLRCRYETTEEPGVSGARNYGIRIAAGEYLVFVDGDDILPKQAVACYMSEMEKRQADIGIGQMEEFHIAGSGIYRATGRLSEKSEISMWDTDLLWTFMISGKCYRTAWIREHNIEFPPLRFSEDGVFFMNCVYEGARLTGIPKVTYGYRKRSPLSPNPSVTGRREKELWNHFEEAHKRILAMAERAIQNGGETGNPAPDGYLQAVWDKFARSILKNFYCCPWNLSDDVSEAVVGCLEHALRQLTEAGRAAIEAAFPELRLNPVENPDVYAAAPKMILWISAKMNENDVALMLRTLYSQTFAPYVTVLPESMRNWDFVYGNIVYVTPEQTVMDVLNRLQVPPQEPVSVLKLTEPVVFPNETLKKAWKTDATDNVRIPKLRYRSERFEPVGWTTGLHKAKRRIARMTEARRLGWLVLYRYIQKDEKWVRSETETDCREPVFVRE